MSLRPCGARRFLCFFTVVVVSLELVLVSALPLTEVSAGALTALLVEVLGSALLLLCEFEMPAVPLSSPFAVLLLEGAAGLVWPLSLLVVCARAPNAESASAAIAMIFTRSPPLEETVETQRRETNRRALAKPRSSSRNHTCAWRSGS